MSKNTATNVFNLIPERNARPDFESHAMIPVGNGKFLCTRDGLYIEAICQNSGRLGIFTAKEFNKFVNLGREAKNLREQAEAIRNTENHIETVEDARREREISKAWLAAVGESEAKECTVRAYFLARAA